jgi:hypothetical protein
MTYDATTPEQAARDMLERMDVPNAQSLGAGDVGDVAQAIAESRKYRRLARAMAMMATGGSKRIQLHHDGTPDGIADAYIEAAEGAR